MTHPRNPAQPCIWEVVIISPDGHVETLRRHTVLSEAGHTLRNWQRTQAPSSKYRGEIRLAGDDPK